MSTPTLGTPSIDVSTSGLNLDIGRTNAATITIGRVASSTIFNGTNTFTNEIITNSINSTAIDSTIQIANSQTTGALYIGSNSAGTGRTSGTINIGTDTTSSGQITIGNSSATCPIVINTASILNTDGAPAIAIGTSGSVKTIKIGNSSTAQTINLSQLSISTNALNNIVGTTGNINIGNLQTAGQLNLGVSTIKTAAINIGTGVNALAVNTNVNIGSSTCVTKLLGTTNQFCYNTASTIPSYINCISGGLNTYLDFYTGAGTVAPTEYDSRILSYGGTGDGTSRTASLYYYATSHIFNNISAVVVATINSTGLIMNKPITFSTGSTPTGTTQLGGITSISYNVSIPLTFTTGTQLSYGSTTITDNGVYIINCFAIATTSAAVITVYGINISTGGTIIASVQSGGVVIGSNQIGQSGNTFATSFSQQLVCSATYQVTASTLISCNVIFLFTSGTVTPSASAFRFTITRIG